MNRRHLLPALALLGMAACSGAPGDDVQSSNAAISPVLTSVIVNVHVTANESTVAITYARVVPAPFTLTLTGPNGTTTLAEGSVNGKTGAQFTGLDECTSYQFTILNAGSAIQSGTIHTLQTGGVACPQSETLRPTRSYQFEGAYHWRNNAPYCYPSNWSQSYREYPLDEPWWYVRQGGQAVGYTHYWNPGANPFPCQEQVVDVQRSFFEWQFDGSRTRRLRSATFQATVDPMSTQVCVSQLASVSLAVWPAPAAYINDTNDFGQAWTSVFPTGIGTGRAMDIIPGSTGIPLTFSGPKATADVTSRAARGFFSGGFAIPNDGFPTPTGQTPDHSAYPEDNNSCGTGFDDVGLALTYHAIAPDTPMNCSVAFNCMQFTVTCDGSPDLFEVHQNRNGADAVISTAYGSVGATTVSATGTFWDIGELQTPVSVCTASVTSGETLRTCTGALPVGSSKACPATCIPACPTGDRCDVTTGRPVCVPVVKCPPETHLCNGQCVPFTRGC